MDSQEFIDMGGRRERGGSIIREMGRVPSVGEFPIHLGMGGKKNKHNHPGLGIQTSNTNLSRKKRAVGKRTAKTGMRARSRNSG